MSQREPVAYTIVENLATNIRELHVLEKQRAGIQAQLIRWCLRALTRADTKDRKLAMIYLQWLATSLETQAVGSPDNIDQKELPCIEE